MASPGSGFAAAGEISRFVNCEEERTLFQRLLRCEDDRRILNLYASGNYGKSRLLRYFKATCRRAGIPASLVALEDGQVITPRQLVERIKKDLVQESLNEFEFPEFNKHYEVISRGTSVAFHRVAESSQPIHVDVTGSDFRSAQHVTIAGVQMLANERPLSEAELETAWDKAIDGFFADVRQWCERKPAVLLLDTYEQCAESLKDWIVAYLLRRSFFQRDNRPQQLILVVAGRQPLPFEDFWSEEAIDRVVVLHPLKPWGREAIEEAAAKIAGGKIPKDELELFLRLSEKGLALPGLIVEMMDHASQRMN
jgi:hypothetical protein